MSEHATSPLQAEQTKLAKQEVQNQRDAEHLRILSDALETGVSILDEDLNYLFISDSVYKQVGISKSELGVGDPLAKCHKLMIENGMLTPEIMAAQRLSTAEQKTRNANHDTDEGRLLTMGNGATYRFQRKNRPDGKTVSIATDVSELVAKDAMLDKALALGQSGYWTLDIESRTYKLGRTLREYFGTETTAKMEKDGILSVIHPDDRQHFAKAISEAAKTSNRFEATCRTVNAVGQERWSRSTGEIIRNAAGKAVRIEAFVKDITRDKRQATELERAKDEAIAASKAKSEFLANMSHEIRTPMNGILGMAELLDASDISDRQKDYVSVINNSASALLTIINDILDFSKIEAGAFEIDPVPFDLKASIDDVAALLRSNAHEKGLELIINYPSNIPKAFIGDAGRIRQVITNLVGNAVKFTESGHIRIDVNVKSARGMGVCTVEVTDTGIGISPEKMNRIFDKFTQADGSTTRVYGGTGLGLTISKAIIEMMSGRMRVRSKLGEGSTFGFRVALPLDVDAKDERFNSSLVENKRALIVDDIDINRTLFTQQLSEWGVTSDTAVDGVDALTKIRNAQDAGQPYDLLLLDFLMPGMNGQEFAQILSQTTSLDTPQIIMLSSCDQPISTKDLSRIGIDSYLIKPVRERRLFETIVRVLSNPVERERTIEVETKPPQRAPIKQDILVAEDFTLNQDVVKLMLADTPFNPVFAENGQVALDMFRAEPDRFPVIVMDVSMPVLDGHASTRAIRKHEKEIGRTPVPIIALTGHALKNDRQDCFNAGMDDYLTKPVKQVQLIEKLETYTGKAITIQRRA